jgi:carbamoyl-phosphate synthase large subunit
MFKDKKIFISWGNGVIGNELVKKLYDAWAKLFVGDLKKRPENRPEDILYREWDLNEITKKELEDFWPEYYFHLAATFERSEETYEFREENFWHNVRLSHYLMTLMKDLPSLKRVIFASSYLIYEPKLYLFEEAWKLYNLQEDDPINPRNLTWMAKLNHEIELHFLDEFRSKQFSSISARIYRSYWRGSRDIISRRIRALLNKEEIIVYKKEGKFDYIFAWEVAEWLIKMASSDKTWIYNLWNGNARSIEEALDILRTHFPEMKYTEKESNIPYEWSEANMDTSQKAFWWKPMIQLEDGIKLILEYEKDLLH